jgi:glycosyltransferase involved in cell wall biosynthesis
MTSPQNISVGLLATEVTSRGGIQSFMLRMAEVIGNVVASNEASAGYCISLNDTTLDLQKNSSIPSQLQVWGAGRSKIKLLSHCFFTIHSIDALLVGHLGLGPIAYLLKKLGRVRRYYVLICGIDAWRSLSQIEHLALSNATNIIAISHYTAQECRHYNQLPADIFRVIHLCADERPIYPSLHFKLNGSFKLLCVARQNALERYKGFEHIFQALSLLKPIHLDIHLNLVGAGNDQERLKQVASNLGVKEQITFWGSLSDEDLAAAYQDCDVFVMPSQKEGFGIVFLEAMRYGKPCIGGNHGGTPEIIEHGKNGYLVEYGDVPGLADCIHHLATDRTLCSLIGANSYKTVKEKFGFNQFFHKYQQIIVNLS